MLDLASLRVRFLERTIFEGRIGFPFTKSVFCLANLGPIDNQNLQ